MKKPHIKPGDKWTIGRQTQKLVKQESNVEVSNEVYVVEYPLHGLVKVQDTVSGTQFDVLIQSLGKKLSS